MATYIFQRVEQKYVLSQTQKEKLLSYLKEYMKIDPYGESTICNIYFDTKQDDLIKTSIEKPLYKEKVRLRSYGVPSMEDKVFLEIKKKYEGVVGKRRVELSLKEALDYLDHGILPKETQIMKEIDYCFKRYELERKLYLAYDRTAYLGMDNPEFRVTFDHNIRSRWNDLSFSSKEKCEYLLKEDTYLMEVKTLGSMPIWFTNILNELQIYPISFSKYGEIYKKEVLRKEMIYV